MAVCCPELDAHGRGWHCQDRERDQATRDRGDLCWRERLPGRRGEGTNHTQAAGGGGGPAGLLGSGQGV